MPALTVCEKSSMFPELGRATEKLFEFYLLIENLRRVLADNEASFSEFIEYVQDKTGLVNEIIEQREKKDEMVDRVENLKELLSEAVEFEARRKKEVETALLSNSEEEKAQDPYLENEPDFGLDLTGILGAYLQNAALYSEGDNADDSEDYVRLMSIHSAKGLEFGAVYVVGVDETIFPSSRSVNDGDVEEERRLMYVALTRAKRKLTVISARSRMLFGQTQNLSPSRFVKEIPPQYMRAIANKRKEQPKEAVNPRYGREPQREKPAYIPTYQANKPQPVRNSDFTPETIKKGMQVVHPRFGEGIVVSCEQVAGDALVCVDFDGMRKNMLLNKSGLKRG